MEKMTDGTGFRFAKQGNGTDGTGGTGCNFSTDGRVRVAKNDDPPTSVWNYYRNVYDNWKHMHNIGNQRLIMVFSHVLSVHMFNREKNDYDTNLNTRERCCRRMPRIII